MKPQQRFCPNVRCHASGQRGGSNIVIHSQKQQRYKCKCCGKTFSETHGTSLYRVKKASEQFIVVVTLLSYGCPVQAIVAAFGLDERTVRGWLHKAGQHAQQIQEEMMSQQQLDLQQVQADESDPEEAALLQEVLEYAERVKDEEQANDDLFIPYIGNPDAE